MPKKVSYISFLFFLFLFSFLLAPFSLSLAQQGEKAAAKIIRGTITDAQTGEALPSANISISGSYRGTISNLDGAYSLSIPDSLLPATIEVRYIGYETQSRRIGRDDASRQHFELNPSVTQLEAITVTGEDPAIGIMREVIRRKQQWRKKLETYIAEAYTRQTLSNDTSIVMITESASRAFWDKEQGHREVLLSRRQTANIEAADNFAGVSYLPNFYDDNIEIAGFEMVGVTHPDALKFYDFELEDRTTMDGQTVFQIRVIPKRDLQPLFEGTVFVLDEEYALLEVSLVPNDVVRFPPPVRSVDLDYEQQFNSFGKDFWLPVDIRIHGSVKIKMVGLEFPSIRFRQVSRISDYRINAELPDSLYRTDDLISVDSAAASEPDSLFVERVDAVPLSSAEQEAYRDLDSTATLQKAFQPSGFLARFIDDEDDEEDGESGDMIGGGWIEALPGSLGPTLRFNRVEEGYLGLRYQVELWDRLNLLSFGGYSTGMDRWDYGTGLEFELIDGGSLRLEAGGIFSDETVTRYSSRLYSPTITLIPNLLGAKNYFDYFRTNGWNSYLRLRHPSSDIGLSVSFTSQNHKSLPVTSGYDLLGRDQALPDNPLIDAGVVNSMGVLVSYNLDEDYPYGVTGLKRIAIRAEHGAGWMQGDYGFTSLRASIDWNFSTFYRRRLLPNTVDLQISAGTSTGNLPLQKFGTVDGTLAYFSPYGSLKTRRGRPYEGEHYLALFAEHNFRTILFERLGLGGLAERNLGIIVFGGMAQTWISGDRRQELLLGRGYEPMDTDGAHYEAGVSLNGILGLFRVDFAQRLDEPAFLVNVSVARLF